MDYSFAQRISSLKASTIREMLKHTAGGKVIPFAAGNPSPDAFPVSAVAEITARILKDDPITALQYGISEGYMPLRDTLKRYLKEQKGIGAGFDELTIMSGAQQGMELATKVLCNEGDTVICENPSFIGSLNAFRSYGLRLAGVDMEADGINTDALEECLKTEKNVRFIYTIPNFQNPSGVTMSYDKRKKVYELAKKYGALILEDDPYGDLRYSGCHIPPIKSLDKDGIVLYVGSFSKIISPGLRVGYILAPEPIVSKITVVKQVSDVHTPLINQMIANEFMNNYDLKGHIEKIRGIYRDKLRLTLDNLEARLSGKVSYVAPEGGLFVYCKLPEGTDAAEFCKRALENGVAIVSGSTFSTDTSLPTSYFRMNFSTPTNEQLVKGIEILEGLF